MTIALCRCVCQVVMNKLLKSRWLESDLRLEPRYGSEFCRVIVYTSYLDDEKKQVRASFSSFLQYARSAQLSVLLCGAHYTSTVTTLSLQFSTTCTHTFDRCFKSTANVVTRWRPDTTATAFSVTCRAIWKIPPCLSLVHVIFTLFCSAISIPVDFFYLFRRSFGVSVRCSC